MVKRNLLLFLPVVLLSCILASAQDTATAGEAKLPDAANQTSGQPPPGAQEGASVSAQELANQVNNPAAPVTFVQFRDILIPSFPGFKGALNSLQMQPVLPIGPVSVLPLGATGEDHVSHGELNSGCCSPSGVHRLRVGHDRV